MRRVLPPLAGVLICLLVFSPVLACIWDHDTLKMERQRFPDALELITGKFLRHTTEFYKWRVTDRLAKIDKNPAQVELYDDLAVAYQKTGDMPKAIETIERKEKVKPGLYETYSNLGTFYVLDGQFDKGIPYVEKAIAINPDAHFGREIYQLHLVKYAQSKMKDGKLSFPMYQHDNAGSERNIDFAMYLEKHADPRHRDVPKAIKGVLGMMRFANHLNPLLLEALGDLLLSGYTDKDAAQLGARAYLQASYQMTDTAAQDAYRDKAKSAIRSHEDMGLGYVETGFKKELAEADEWYKTIAADEAAWIAANTNVDEKFDAKYYKEPALSAHAGTNRNSLLFLLLLPGVLLILIGMYWRRRNAAQPAVKGGRASASR